MQSLSKRASQALRFAASARICRADRGLRGAASTVPAAGVRQTRARDLYDELKTKFGYMGAVNHKTVGVLDLYELMQEARDPTDYLYVLQAMNLMYNFGVKLKHRELAGRLLATAMVCKVETEAAELIKLYGTWLAHPPDSKLVYAVMGHFLDRGEPLVVREIAKAVREDWRMKVESPLYSLAIEAMLQMPEEPLTEALALYRDAGQVGVKLPPPLHVRLLDESIRSFEAACASTDSGVADDSSEGAAEEGDGDAAGDANGAAGGAADDSAPGTVDARAIEHLRVGVEITDRLATDGHLHGGANAATLCSVGWLFWHLSSPLLAEGTRASLLAEGGSGVHFCASDCPRVLQAAADNFGCHWGFSNRLPQGFFRTLEASPDPEVARLVNLSRSRFGRFYPAESAEA